MANQKALLGMWYYVCPRFDDWHEQKAEIWVNKYFVTKKIKIFQFEIF